MWRKTVVLKNPKVIDYLDNNVVWGGRDKFIEDALLEKITREYETLTKEDIINTIKNTIKQCGGSYVPVQQKLPISEDINKDSILAVLNGLE